MIKGKYNFILFFSLFLFMNSLVKGEFFEITSRLDKIETIYVEEDGNRINRVRGSGGFEIKALKNGAGNNSPYLFFVIRTNSGDTYINFTGNKDYIIEETGLKITVKISNTSILGGSLNGNMLSLNNDLAIVNFSYEAIVETSGEFKEQKIQLVFGAAKNNSQTAIDDSTDFLQLDIKKVGNRIEVTLNPLDFGTVNFGANRAESNMKIALKNPNTSKNVEELKIQYDKEVLLSPVTGVGTNIPVNINLSGGSGQLNNLGEYVIIGGLTSTKSETNIKIIGETVIELDQKSGDYQGKMKVRVIYK